MGWIEFGKCIIEFLLIIFYLYIYIYTGDSNRDKFPMKRVLFIFFIFF